MKRNLLFTSALCATFALTACGDNDGSSDENELASSSSLLELDEDSYIDTSAQGNIFNSGLGESLIIKGEVYDSKSDRTYKTIQFGAYIWMAENVNNESYGICYNNSNKNCDTYGTLHQARTASSVCPENFSIPSEYDYKYMINFAGRIDAPNFGFDLQLGGLCSSSSNCKYIDQAANLITSDYKALQYAKGYASIIEDKNSEYYSVRCASYSYFVEKPKLLPTCNSSTYYKLDDFFVASMRTNYTCKNEKWVETESSACPYRLRGQKHYYKNLLYICDGTWRLATMNDVDEECNEDNEWTIKKINGQKYICKDSLWREPTMLEDSLGLCTPENNGQLDSLESDSTLYYCDSTGWRKSIKTDIIGTCDSASFYKVAEYKDTVYTCRIKGYWETLSSLEDEIGVCTPKRFGEIDTLESDREYVCDSAGWRTPVSTDYLGRCDESNRYSIAKDRYYTYACRENGRWTELDYREEQLGICTPEKIGTIDTMPSGYDYICDSTGWKEASLSDYIGACDSSKIYTTTDYNGTTYACIDIPTWEELAYPESDIGFCTPSLQDSIRVDSYGTSLVCDTRWRAAKMIDILGECTTAREGEAGIYKSITYVCTEGAWQEPDDPVDTPDDSLATTTPTSKPRQLKL